MEFRSSTLFSGSKRQPWRERPLLIRVRLSVRPGIFWCSGCFTQEGQNPAPSGCQKNWCFFQKTGFFFEKSRIFWNIRDIHWICYLIRKYMIEKTDVFLKKSDFFLPFPYPLVRSSMRRRSSAFEIYPSLRTHQCAQASAECVQTHF